MVHEVCRVESCGAPASAPNATTSVVCENGHWYTPFNDGSYTLLRRDAFINVGPALKLPEEQATPWAFTSAEFEALYNTRLAVRAGFYNEEA